MAVDLVERFGPFLGAWVSEAAGPGIASRMVCRRRFMATPGGAFVVMLASWPSTTPLYEEVATFAPGLSGLIIFTSSTSDHQRSTGRQAAPEGVHPESLVFEAQTPDGPARFIYRSESEDAFLLAVESAAPVGWSRFMEHRYRRETAAA